LIRAQVRNKTHAPSPLQHTRSSHKIRHAGPGPAGPSPPGNPAEPTTRSPASSRAMPLDNGTYRAHNNDGLLPSSSAQGRTPVTPVRKAEDAVPTAPNDGFALAELALTARQNIQVALLTLAHSAPPRAPVRLARSGKRSVTASAGARAVEGGESRRARASQPGARCAGSASRRA